MADAASIPLFIQDRQSRTETRSRLPRKASPAQGSGDRANLLPKGSPSHETPRTGPPGAATRTRNENRRAAPLLSRTREPGPEVRRPLWRTRPRWGRSGSAELVGPGCSGLPSPGGARRTPERPVDASPQPSDPRLAPQEPPLILRCARSRRLISTDGRMRVAPLRGARSGRGETRCTVPNLSAPHIHPAASAGARTRC